MVGSVPNPSLAYDSKYKVDWLVTLIFTIINTDDTPCDRDDSSFNLWIQWYTLYTFNTIYCDILKMLRNKLCITSKRNLNFRSHLVLHNQPNIVMFAKEYNWLSHLWNIDDNVWAGVFPIVFKTGDKLCLIILKVSR